MISEWLARDVLVYALLVRTTETAIGTADQCKEGRVRPDSEEEEKVEASACTAMRLTLLGHSQMEGQGIALDKRAMEVVDQ